ncbi:MAG TPA: hypothetical protein VM261_14140 [Kofleriaceae bacterium]|nr:hypothetical protein [Kofleriaceae bacterium]
MRPHALAVFSVVVACGTAACFTGETPPERDISPIDAMAIDVPTDSIAPRTCNLDPRGRLVAEMGRAGDALVAYYQANGGFPATSQAASPTASCCTQNAGGLHCCAVVPAEWDVATWNAFGFAQTEPFEFQFAYTGVAGGLTSTMTATGDLDCDGTSITYTLACTSSGGVPTCELVAPTNMD